MSFEDFGREFFNTLYNYYGVPDQWIFSEFDGIGGMSRKWKIIDPYMVGR